MNKIARLVMVLVVVAALAAVGVILWRRAHAAPPPPPTVAKGTPVLVEAVTRGALNDQIVLTGSAEADHDSTINAEVPGNVAAVYVRVGDRVRAGQALVRLDTDLASAQLAQSSAMVRSAQARRSQAQVNVRLTEESTQVGVRQAEIGVQAAREQLQKAKAAYDLTRSQIENGIAQAQTGLDSAQATLRDVQAGARSQEIAQAQAALAQARAALSEAQAALRQARSDYERQKALKDAGAISQQQLDTAQTNADLAQARAVQAQARVDQAAEALSLAKAGARTEQVRLAELGVQQARQALQLAESRRDQVNVAQRDVNAAEAALSNARQQLAMARAQRQQVALQEEEARAAAASVGQARAGEQYARTGLAKLYIRAPFDGQVAERLAEPGLGAGSGTPLIRLVDLQPMKVKAQVSELQVARLRVGQTAQVTVDALAGRTFIGRLARMSPAANPGQRMYTVEIEVNNAQELIKPGMFCRATVVLATVADALLVSRDALVENADQRLVYAVENGKIAVREVTIGAQSDNHVQILSGAREGDQLVVSGQSLLAAGQAVKPQQRQAQDVKNEPAALETTPGNGT
jgi:HlyD family secretion protein